MIYNPHGDDLVTPAFYLGQCGQQGHLLPPLCKYCKEKKTATRQELRVGKEEKPGRAGSPQAFWACGGACSHRQTVLTLSRGLGEVGEGGCIHVAAVPSPQLHGWAFVAPKVCTQSKRVEMLTRVFSDEDYFCYLISWLSAWPLLQASSLQNREISLLPSDHVAPAGDPGLTA